MTFSDIYVNNSAAKTRQIFTLFRELGHLLFHTSGIDPLDDQYVERFPSARGISKCCATVSRRNSFCRKKRSRRPLPANGQPTGRPKFFAARFHLSRESTSANSSIAT